MISNKPQVDVDTHIVFRERKCQCKPFKSNIAEGSFGAVTHGPEQSSPEFLHLEIQLESVLMNFGTLRFFFVKNACEQII